MSRRFLVVHLSTYSHALPKPIAHYQANIVWSGIKRVNTTDRTCRQYYPDFTIKDRSVIVMEELPYPNQLSQVDNIETSNITVYSKKMWSENDQLFFEVKKGE
jgi:hypothetical protein